MEGFDGPGWPLLWEVDKLISQIPTLPPMVPGRGVVGHYIDRCISGSLLIEVRVFFLNILTSHLYVHDLY